MACFYTFHSDRRLVVSACAGTLTVDTMRAHREALMADPAFDPTWSQIIDFSGVTEVELTVGSTAPLLETDPWAECARRAIIAPTDLLFGLARFYQQQSAFPASIVVCRTPLEAERWVAGGDAPAE